MTKVLFLKKDGVFYGFEESGHACFSEDGNDVLCAAISAMTMLVVNTIEISYATNVDYQIDDKSTTIKVVAKGALEKYESDEKKRFAVSGAIAGFFFQLNDLIEDYYDFLEVEEEERDI